MGYLLDTTVISEPMQARPSERVVSWMREHPNTLQFMSVLTMGELRKGVERLPEGARREKYRAWLEDTVPLVFGDRLLPVSREVADNWGRLLAAVGRSVPIVDSLIAATALHHDLRLVTRNERDFTRFPGLLVVNPWAL